MNFERWIAQARQDFLAYLTGSRFNEVPKGLRQAMTDATVRKVEPRLGLALAMIATGAHAASAEAVKVKEEGRDTKPWFPGD